MDASQKSFQIQSQIRYNAEELKNTLNDLYSWEKEIKEKEVELQRQPVERVATGATTEKSKNQNELEVSTPPIRSQILRGNMQNNKKIVESDNAPKMFQQKQSNPGKAETPTEKVEMPTDPNEEKRKEASAIKDRGNECVKKKEYVKAIEEYTNAIDKYPEDATFYTNRALCYLKLQKYYDCIEDCERALEIDIRSLKAYYRRMQANENLGNDIDAYKDCQTILAMDPKNTDAKHSLERITRTLTSRVISKTGPSFSDVRSDMCFIEPVDKPPHTRSNKPLRRIYITDVVGPKKTKSEEHSNLQVSDDVIEKIFNSDCGPFVEVKKEPPLKEEGISKLTAITSSSIRATEKLEKSVENEVEAKKSKKIVDQKQSKGKETKNINNESKNALKEKPVKDTGMPQTGDALGRRDEEKPLESLSTNLGRPLTPAPTCTAQFYANWKELSAFQKYQYLKLIDNKKLCKILGAGFDSDTLTDIISILYDFYIPKKDPDLASTLLEVSRNNQVSILSMLMTTNDRKALTEILNSLKEGNEDSAMLALIAKNFHLL